jgi:hypothetical protein
MKYLPPLACALLVAGCAITPEQQEAAHQSKLEKEARENFLALKAKEHPDRPPTLNDVPGAPARSQRESVASAPPAKSKVASNAPPTSWFAPKPRPSQHYDDTVYYWQVPGPRSPGSIRFQAAEARYARELAKRPEDLTPEERLYAHEHY